MNTMFSNFSAKFQKHVASPRAFGTLPKNSQTKSGLGNEVGLGKLWFISEFKARFLRRILSLKMSSVKFHCFIVVRQVTFAKIIIYSASSYSFAYA